MYHCTKGSLGRSITSPRGKGKKTGHLPETGDDLGEKAQARRGYATPSSATRVARQRSLHLLEDRIVPFLETVLVVKSNAGAHRHPASRDNKRKEQSPYGKEASPPTSRKNRGNNTTSFRFTCEQLHLFTKKKHETHLRIRENDTGMAMIIPGMKAPRIQYWKRRTMILYAPA